jgi:two-component system chemotaxis sensor kinase CheA
LKPLDPKLLAIFETELRAHRLEALFVAIRERRLAAADNPSPAIGAVLDAVEDILAAVLGATAEPDLTETLRLLDRLLDEPQPAWQPRAPDTRERSVPPEGPRPETVRVSATYIDDLVRSSAQLLATRESRARSARGVEDFCRAVRETGREWQRLRTAASPGLRRMHAAIGQRKPRAEYASAPNDQAPDLRPITACLDFMDERLRRLAAQARATGVLQGSSLSRWSQLADRVHEDACRVLMTPADSVFDGFRKMVRDMARDDGKEVEFVTEGMDVQVDRRVLQALKDAVMHLLRNAVSHGIEPPAERVAAGKNQRGLIRLRLEARGGTVEIAVEDDGRGIDLQRVAEAAVSRGMLTAAAAAQPAPELKRLILEPGFSTSRSATPLSGRGIGLTIAREQVTKLQGEIFLRERPGAGTCVVLVAPISISTQHVVMAGCGRWTFGLPARSVERLCRFRPEEVETREGKPGFRVEDRWVPLARLAGLLGLPEAAPPAGSGGAPARIFAAIMKMGGQRLGLIVDALVDEREAVIQDAGLPAKWTGLILGAVALEDGGVAVVLNVAALWERFRAGTQNGAPLLPAPGAAGKPASVLVVDDSITTRALEKSILEAHGYRVRLAVDGVQALEQLREEPADLVIADVMMPRMDGMELLRRIKADRTLAEIPVIIVSSVEARQEQERGLSLGADAYIVKRKFDHHELLRVVRQLL